MDDVNPTMEMVDVAIVVGANDRREPIRGRRRVQPDLRHADYQRLPSADRLRVEAWSRRWILRMVNSLFFRENCRMIYGDAKATLTGLVAQFKD